MPYKILHHRLFEKEIVKIPAHHQRKIYRLISTLAENPQKLPPNTTVLTGYKNAYRTRLGDFRLVYQLHHQNQTIILLGVSSRGEVYKLIRRLLG